MATKNFLFIAIGMIALINVSIFGTLFIVNLIAAPSIDKTVVLETGGRSMAKQRIYDQLAPVAEFKSKASYIPSIGEAVVLCESRLKSEVTEAFSHAVNMIESRYLKKAELYKIYIYYETAATAARAGARFKVNCVVSAEKKLIVIWKINDA